ncbi:MAG: hypothetical protein ABI140_01700 [Jatrophihabitantaceae bacterium]
MSNPSDLAPEAANRIGVLIVDDHRMFADSLARLLSDEQYLHVVGGASSGKQALELPRTGSCSRLSRLAARAF